ncbi:unnamed protein product [Nippostrongylus brasiliensis]|uniref:Transmembrane protein n=1 Tax=Nippostrongylus brasiliensis TaxID=27835 RepID=A0A0N4YWD0_NIPBR|nr:unnamed protein product [Nippostrongylus brasiliensis]
MALIHDLFFRYFSSANDESKTRCEDECEEVYYSFFTYGKCVGDIFGKLPKDQQPACNLRCGVRPRLWTTIGLFCVFAAALATLIFTIPMCVATCASCLHAKKRFPSSGSNLTRIFSATTTMFLLQGGELVNLLDLTIRLLSVICENQILPYLTTSKGAWHCD